MMAVEYVIEEMSNIDGGIVKVDCQNKLWNLLSLREQQTLKLLVRGLTAKQSAKILGISPRTIEAHTNAIKKKFKCATKVAIICKLL